VTNVATWILSALGGLLTWITDNQAVLALVPPFIVAFGNWYYNKRADGRNAAEHEARMTTLKKK